jgi:hypothetical protein
MPITSVHPYPVGLLIIIIKMSIPPPHCIKDIQGVPKVRLYVCGMPRARGKEMALVLGVDSTKE